MTDNLSNDVILKVKNLYKNYTNDTETLEILQDVNFEVTKNRSVSITGESGSGKSTFLHLIGGLDNCNSGEILINNQDITLLDEESLSDFRNTEIGFVFQSHYLIEEFTAVENVMIPGLIKKFNKKKVKTNALDLLDQVGLSERINHHPSQLSGGERQRVAIARALINQPSIILADEPTGNLDSMNADKILDVLFMISNKMQRTLIIVTHSQHIASMTDSHYHLEMKGLSKQ